MNRLPVPKRPGRLVIAFATIAVFIGQNFCAGAQAQFASAGQKSFCRTPQYPSFSHRGIPGSMQVPQRYMPPVKCTPGFTYGCAPFIPQVPVPLFFGPSLITETINCVETPSSLNPDGTTTSGTDSKSRVESLLPSLQNAKPVPDTTGSTDTDMSSVLDSVFKDPKQPPDSSCLKAAKLCKKGKFVEALGLIDREGAPGQHMCSYVRANANLGLGRLEEALKDIRKSHEADPNFPPGYFTEGTILSELNKLPDAVKAYSKALSLRPDFVRCLDARAGAYFRLGQFIDAIRDFERALAQDPRDANALYMRGLCYFMIGQYQIVPICYNDYLAFHPNDVAALANRGSAYFELGKYAEAMADFDKVLSLEPAYVTCLYKRCLANWHLGRWQPALQDADSALKVMGWKEQNSAYLALCSYLLLLKDKNHAAAQIRLKDSLDNLDPSMWPYPLFQYFAGRITETELLEKASTQEHWTQAKTYIAIRMAWSTAEKDRVLALLELVRKDGASNVPEYNLAVGELFRNKVKDVTNIGRPIKNKFALVVGVSKFKDQAINLRYPDKDAQDFGNFLVSTQGFPKQNVKILLNHEATRENILGALGDNWLPRSANKDDLVLIYFSTHGSPSAMDAQGINYLLAHDTDKEVLYATGIPVQDLTRMVRDKVHADRIVVIMDACHSGAARAGDALKIDADSIASQSGQAVICSSLPEEVSWESKQYPNSVFTRHLIDGLKSRGAATTLSDTFAYTREQVAKEVWSDRKSKQTPVMKSTWAKTDLTIAGK